MKKAKNILLLLLMITVFLSLATPVSAATHKINKKKATLYVAQTLKLKVSGYKKVKWKSSNKKIATVNKKGLVTAKAKGKASITATVGNKKYVCKITVKPNEWKYPYDIRNGDGWNNYSAVLNLSGCEVQFLPYRLYYDKKGKLNAVIAVSNNTEGKRFYYEDIELRFFDKNRDLIAIGTFAYNKSDGYVDYNEYDFLTVLFNKGTKKVCRIKNWAQFEVWEG